MFGKGEALKKMWNSGGATLGVWTTLADPVAIGLAARAGFDYICIDLQHGLATFSELPTILRYLRGSGTSPIVRVPANDDYAIHRALDLGASGVVVPMVNTASEAASAVFACRYPALPGIDDSTTGPGGRSWGPIFADLDGPRNTDDDNKAVMCIVQVETRQAIDNLEAIAAVPGIDALYVGPNDLALSCGFGQDTYRKNSDIDAMIRSVLDACDANGIVAGIHCSDLEMVRDWKSAGARMLTTGTDTTIYRTALRQHYAAASEGNGSGRMVTGAADPATGHRRPTA